MPIKKITLGGCLLLAGFAIAPAKTYTIHEGDTISKIARKFGVPQNSLLRTNGLKPTSTLTIGSKITIPNLTEKRSSSEPRTTKNQRKYRVQEGENDWTISQKFDTTVATLHRLNPQINWNALQIGTPLIIPGAAVPQISSPTRVASNGSYRVVPGDNDNRIARKLGITPVQLHRLNPGQAWTRLQIGQKLNTPGGSKVATSKHSGTKVASKQAKQKFVKAKKAPVALRNSISGNRLLDTARSFRGVRYRYGSMSRSGTDCSGFTSQVFRAMGIKLPRTSREQSGIGRSIGKASLKAGDLVFFRTCRSSRINHVGIYMGSGQFIHASSGGGHVMVSSLNEGYYQRCYAAARRVANVGSKQNKILHKIAKDQSEESPKQTLAEVDPFAEPIQNSETDSPK